MKEMDVIYRVTLKSSIVALKAHLQSDDLLSVIDHIQQADIFDSLESKKLRKIVDEDKHESVLSFIFVLGNKGNLAFDRLLQTLRDQINKGKLAEELISSLNKAKTG